MFGQTAMLAARQSQISGALLGSLSPYSPQGWQSTTPFHMDDTAKVQTCDGSSATFGGTVRFTLPKNSTLIGDPIFKVSVSAAVLAADRSAAYVNGLGDQLVETVTLRYGSSILQVVPHSIWTPMWRRLTRNDAHVEPVHAMVLAGLPVQGDTEAMRESAVTDGLDLYVPLDELYFAKSKSQYWFPESLSLEGEIILKLAPLGSLVYSDNGDDPFAGATYPALSGAELHFHEVTISSAEKENRLRQFATEQGVVTLFKDIETQLSQNLGVGGDTGLDRVVRVDLDNIRLDIATIVFVVRVATNSTGGVTPAVNAPWRGDPFESNTENSIITGGDIACAKPITSFALEANGKRIYNEMTDFENRAVTRRRYFADAQVFDPYYFISFSNFPQDANNSTGHISASILGRLQLVITLPDWAATQTLQCDVLCHSYNILQARSGAIVKALN